MPFPVASPPRPSPWLPCAWPRAAPSSTGAKCPSTDADLVALLPCKPDRAQRDLAARHRVRAPCDMTGCEAGGATFAVAHASAADAAQAESWLAAWRAQTRAQLAGAPFAESAGQRASRAAGRAGAASLDGRRGSRSHRGGAASCGSLSSVSATARGRSTRPRCSERRQRPTRSRRSSKDCAYRDPGTRGALRARPWELRRLIIDSEPAASPPHEQHLHHRPFTAGARLAAVRAACVSRQRAERSSRSTCCPTSRPRKPWPQRASRWRSC